MKKWNNIVVVAFLLTTMSLVFFQYTRTRALRVQEIDSAKVALERAKIQQKLENIKVYARVKFIGSISFFLGLCGGGLLFAVVYYRRHNVHEQTIAGSIIKVRYHDLSKLVPVCVQLAEVEQLKASSPQHYISELLQIMAEHRKYFQAVFPHQAHAIPDQTLPAHIPTFLDLLNAGELTHAGDLVVGVLQTGSLKRINWLDFVSSSLAGQSGSGKTSTLRSIVAQAALQANIRIVLIDPHESAPGSLCSTLAPLLQLPYVTAFQKFDIAQGISGLLNMIERRKSGQESCEQIVLIIFEEIGELIRGCQEAKELINQVGSRTRKLNIFGVFSNQSWSAKLFNGSDIRDNLISTISHKAKRRQAQILFDDNHIAKKVARLHCGQLIGRGRGFDEDEIINVPYCSNSDVDAVYRKCQQSLPVDTPVNHHEPEESKEVDTLTRLKEMLEKRTITQKEITVSTGIDKGLLSNILKGKRIMSTAVNQKLSVLVSKCMDDF